ncbi:MAG: hypothetical protein PF448_07155 [Bacteroidales bacterium]|jgi:hypothetical protein|nr:hypothetical protein [Bacteroidales bacterium]
MKKMKTTILALAVCLSSLTTQAQTIKDFFVPTSPKNKATFYSPSKTGGRTDMTRTIYYVDKGNSYDITDAKMFNGNPTVIQTKTVIFSDNEVKMTKSVSTTMMETNKQRNHNPPTVLLKMPALGKTATWSYTEISGDVANCKASWTTVDIDGKTLKAIKVEEEVVDGFGITILYYVQGIGLWKKDFKGSDGTIQPFEKFDQLSYDPTAK